MFNFKIKKDENKDLIFIFFLSKKEIGRITLLKYENCYELTDLGIKKSFQGKGYARKIMLTAIDKYISIKENEALILKAYAHDGALNQKELIKFYERLSFIESKNQDPLTKKYYLLMEHKDFKLF